MGRKLLLFCKTFFFLLLFLFLFCLIDVLIYYQPASPELAEYWFFGYWNPRNPGEEFRLLKGMTPLIALALFYFPRRKKEICFRRKEECGVTFFSSSRWIAITLHARMLKAAAVFLLILLLLHYAASIFLLPAFSPFCLMLIPFAAMEQLIEFLSYHFPNAVLTMGINLFSVPKYTYEPMRFQNALVFVELFCFLGWYCLLRLLLLTRSKMGRPSFSKDAAGKANPTF